MIPAAFRNAWILNVGASSRSSQKAISLRASTASMAPSCTPSAARGPPNASGCRAALGSGAFVLRDLSRPGPDPAGNYAGGPWGGPLRQLGIFRIMVLLDRSTLMVVFAVMTLTMLVLFYFDTYRKSRAPFAGWWCGAVASFFLAAVFYFMGEVQDGGLVPQCGQRRDGAWLRLRLGGHPLAGRPEDPALAAGDSGDGGRRHRRRRPLLRQRPDRQHCPVGPDGDGDRPGLRGAVARAGRVLAPGPVPRRRNGRLCRLLPEPDGRAGGAGPRRIRCSRCSSAPA